MQADGQWDGKTRYTGASAGALAKLAAEKGYSLVYCESHGVNCFFVRNDMMQRFGLTAMTFSDVRGVQQIHRFPNYFGKGWTYPESNSSDEWVWV